MGYQELYSEEYTFFGHSPGGTWHEGDVAVVLWFVAHPWLVMFIAALSMVACTIFAYKRWKRRQTTGYTRVQTVEPDETDTQASEKRVFHPSRRLLHGILSQMRVLFGRKNEHERLSMHMLSGASHAADSDDRSTV
jgi:hypothetical protein